MEEAKEHTPRRPIMTTAHRPTWKAALGASNQGGAVRHVPTQQFSARNLPAHLKLKTRKAGQGTADEVAAMDMKADLERREREHFAKKRKADEADLTIDRQLEAAVEKRAKLKSATEYAQLDQDDVSESSSDSSDDEDEDDDEMLELLAELEKIKKERAEEEEAKERERLEAAAREKNEAVLRGNPLLQNVGGGGGGGAFGGGGDSFTFKKAWTEDTVFKNQATDMTRKKKEKTFINDTIRNDFHKKFLKKYIH